MIRLAVFDMAGTTVADDNFVAKAFKNAFLKKGYEINEEQINPLMGYKKIGAIKTIMDQLGEEYDQELLEEIHNDFENAMIEFYESDPQVKAMSHAEEVFMQFKERGITVALNTGFPRTIADAIVDRLQWMDRGLIDYYIASDEVEEGRPHPSMIQELMMEAGVKNSKEVIKIGDTTVDIEEGINADCLYVIAVTTGAASRSELEKYNPTHIIDDLSEIIPLLQPVSNAY